MNKFFVHIVLLLLPAFAFAKGDTQKKSTRNGDVGTMWQQLATSPYRLDTADVRTLRVELESISFFRNNEFPSPLADGYSLPGLWVQPKLTYMPLKQIKVELGLQALIFNGTNRYPN